MAKCYSPHALAIYTAPAGSDSADDIHECHPQRKLFGLTIIQAYVYFRTHAGGWTKFYRVVVLLLWALDAVHVGLTVHCVYYYLVINFANYAALTEAIWSFQLQVVFNVLTIYVIHLLYSHRIWIVGRDRSKIFRIIPCIVIILSSGVAIVLFWVVYHHNSSAGLFLDRWTVFMALSVAAFLDILITTSLWYLLASSRTGFAETDCLISRLMCYTMDSGCLDEYMCIGIHHYVRSDATKLHLPQHPVYNG
ncbi:hypothetical protein EDD22DRAFT_541708 [Suillus occidentalis]|nr:hypothetical protein EDD22DRAFT_541708 [Suillus occidentalis]